MARCVGDGDGERGTKAYAIFGAFDANAVIAASVHPGPSPAALDGADCITIPPLSPFSPNARPWRAALDPVRLCPRGAAGAASNIVRGGDDGGKADSRRSGGGDAGRNPWATLRRNLSDPNVQGNPTPAPFWIAAPLFSRRETVRDRQTWPRHVRCSVGPCRDQPTRRHGPCGARRRPGSGPISGGSRAALQPRHARRWNGGRRCRDPAD